MKGCDDFNRLWLIDVITLADLVQSKKTQRDKDWLMIDRLIQNDIMLADKPSAEKISWWLLECRRPDSLIELAKRHQDAAKKQGGRRPLIEYAIEENPGKLRIALKSEEESEKEKDRLYWAPLRKELEMLRLEEAKKKRAAKKQD